MASDGVQIAYAVDARGAGTPLLLMAAPFTDVRMSHWGDFGMPVLNGVELGTRPTAWFDFRGCGRSARNVNDVSMDVCERDLEAVIERLSWPKFSLLGLGIAGPLSIKYASEHPERVSSLVLRETYARASDMGHIARIRSLGALARDDFASYLVLLAFMTYGWTSEGDAIVRMLADCATEEAVQMYAAATSSYNATAFIEGIQARTLIIGREDTRVSSGEEMARQLGARIRDARVHMVKAGSLGVTLSALIEAFLSEGDAPVSSAAPASPSGGQAAVILLTDIAESTALTERVGDARFREMSRSLDAGLRAAIRDAGGVTVEAKTLGDGVLATFGSAAQAIEGARRCLALSAASELGLHIGVHAGDVIREEGNVFGGAVNIAARICGLSAAGEILVSDVVRGMARSSAGVVFDDRGEQEMKGVGEPVRVYAVRGAT
jgi:class 3 adenylate cyclase